ncbi:RHS repeat domain-containing protein [Xanthomonas indica]|uniref:RHS repeat-associated core domain-containing protein n=1 Tax=Xanthomonas indica TaxID=2912242 RepID=A0AAU8I719_9XANT|nr:RHS repeat-associated core domain-containing protein [Xanthomonas indica]MCI2260485.1 RHS repeat-associated core domain-containing protein [Xanthomonas indica]
MSNFQGIRAVMRLMAATVLSLFVAFGALAQTVRYIHTDGLGSLVLATDKDRNIIERSEYEPYGYLLNRPAIDGPGYTGHVTDVSTTFTYMQQRYYDPLLGRMLSVDPITVNQSKDLRQFGRYNYSYGNPYKFIDPDGRIVKLADLKDKKAIEGMIRSRSAGKFKFDKDGKLKQSKSSANQKGRSTYYQSKLNAAIDSSETITVGINSTFTDPMSGNQEDVDSAAGGGVTVGRTHGGDQEVTISGNPLNSLKDTSGAQLRDDPADILMHEMVGHAIPHVVGSDTGNAVDNENKARSEIPGSGIRAAEPWHGE